MAKNNKTIFFRKVAILLKVSVVEYWDQLFWIPRTILDQKHLLPQPYQTHIHLDVARPKHMLYELGRFFLLSIHQKITKTLQGALFLSTDAENHRSTLGRLFLILLLFLQGFHKRSHRWIYGPCLS